MMRSAICILSLLALATLIGDFVTTTIISISSFVILTSIYIVAFFATLWQDQTTLILGIFFISFNNKLSWTNETTDIVAILSWLIISTLTILSFENIGKELSFVYLVFCPAAILVLIIVQSLESYLHERLFPSNPSE